MEQSTNPEPPPDWMLPEFDPNSAKVAELRSILLENNIPHSYTKKSHLVELFERQVRPLAPKLLKAHRSVKPSAVGIFDMRTGQLITEPAAKSPRKPSSSVRSTDQESHQSTTSTRRTRRPSVRNLQERKQPTAEADSELTPQASSNRGQRSHRRSTLIDPSSEKPSRQLGKRKAEEQTLDAEVDELESEHDQSARPSKQTDTSNSSASLMSSSIPIRSSASPVPVKKRRSELPTQSASNDTNADDDQPAISKKKISKPKNRRTTLHEAIESGEGRFSDFNPFQSGSEDDISGNSSRKPNRQSSIPRPSMTPARLPKSMTTPNIYTPHSPTKLNPASQQVPVYLSSPSYQPLKTNPTFLPKSVTTSNVHSLQTPARESVRKSGAFPSLPSHRRLTLSHLQDDADANNSFEFGTPEQIQQLLAPSEARVAHNQTDAPAEMNVLPNRAMPNSVQSRHQSQLPPRTPCAQPPVHNSSSLQFQTPLPRHPIQRIKLDEFVHSPAEKRLKINRAPKRASPTSRGGFFFNPSQGISFLLRLGCLGLMFGIINWYLRQAESLGYCDTGMTSNAMTRDQRIDQFLALDNPVSDAAADSYRGNFRATLIQVLEAASMIGVLPDCQPCPPHAICERGKIVTCEPDFVQTHSDWEKLIHGWIPMIMGPKCAPDTAKLIKIVQIGNQIHQILRKHRGKVLCGMGLRASDEEMDKTVKVDVYGLKEKEIKETIEYREDLKSSLPSGPPTWSPEDEIIELAIKDLEQSGEIVRSTDGWLATSSFKSMEMGFTCRLKLAFFKLIKKFKLVLISIALAVFGWIYLKITISKNNQEKQKVRELVEVALNKLRNESWIHHTNPALSPNPPTLASAQLRDLILSYEHSPLNRQKLWKKVEKIVEGNSNVRTKVSELRGESIKVWEWIGSYKGHFDIHHSASPMSRPSISHINDQLNSSPPETNS